MHWLDLNRTFIIAEAGVNHNGNLAMAKALIDGAAAAGADAVKFQMFDPTQLTSKETPLAAYQMKQEGLNKSQRDLLSALSLSAQDFAQLQAYCKQAGILFLCTPFDNAAARYLALDLQVPMLKISSGELTNLPFLQMLGCLDTPIILSTGMGTLAEVQAAIESIRTVNSSPLALLHCVSSYPAPVEAVNLRAMQTLKNAFPDCVIGYSDHTLGIHVSVAAVALGAQIVEKHFTLDPSLPGPDHQASLTVDELKQMVRAIREVEQALGDGIKRPHPVEEDCIRVARKSLVARQDLAMHHVLTSADLQAKRPGTGISPADLHHVVGKTLRQPLREDELLHYEMLER
jgi:N,N'-diacetyllegionaminate synthase